MPNAVVGVLSVMFLQGKQYVHVVTHHKYNTDICTMCIISWKHYKCKVTFVLLAGGGFQHKNATTGYFLTRRQDMSSLVCGNKTSHFKPKHDHILNLTKCHQGRPVSLAVQRLCPHCSSPRFESNLKVKLSTKSNQSFICD